MTRISTRSCRALLARGSLSCRNMRLNLRILASLGDGETTQESNSSQGAIPFKCHMRFPYPSGGEEKERESVVAPRIKLLTHGAAFVGTSPSGHPANAPRSAPA